MGRKHNNDLAEIRLLDQQVQRAMNIIQADTLTIRDLLGALDAHHSGGIDQQACDVCAPLLTRLVGERVI